MNNPAEAIKPADSSALPTVTQPYRLSFRCAQQCLLPTGDFNDFAESDQHCLQSLGGPGTFALGQQRADPYPPRSADHSQRCHVNRTTNGELWQGSRPVSGWSLLPGHGRGVLTRCNPPRPTYCIGIPCEKRNNPDGTQTKNPLSLTLSGFCIFSRMVGGTGIEPVTPAV